jgi:hypothetical protein
MYLSHCAWNATRELRGVTREQIMLRTKHHHILPVLLMFDDVVELWVHCLEPLIQELRPLHIQGENLEDTSDLMKQNARLFSSLEV